MGVDAHLHIVLQSNQTPPAIPVGNQGDSK